MAWKPTANSPLGLSVPGNVDAAATVTVGTVAKFVDDTQGEGTFIYLPGVANVVAGDAMEYDLTPGAVATIRHSNATASNSGRQIAIASAAIIATTFGWFQIEGVAIVNTIGGTVAGVAMGHATTGSLANTADAGDQILNARILTAVGTPAAGKSYVQITRPFVQGQIT
jgi:hypothetical protein